MEKELLPAIENRIYTIRGQQVMLDSDLSEIFNVQVKRINEQVTRNLSRFPSDFAFQLSSGEWHQLKSQIATSNNTKGGKVKVPRVFTEHGIEMLATLLRSDLAIQMSVFIIKVFVQSRANSAVLQSIDNRLIRLEKESALAHAVHKSVCFAHGAAVSLHFLAFNSICDLGFAWPPQDSFVSMDFMMSAQPRPQQQLMF